MSTLIIYKTLKLNLKTSCHLFYVLLTALSPKASKTKPADDDELSIVYLNYFILF